MAAVPVLGTAENPGPQNPETKARTNLIVNYLPQNLTEDGLKALFSPYGVVQSCKLIVDKTTHTSLGYGFVNYGTPEEADAAIEKLNGASIDKKVLKVSYARPSSVSIKNANVYVANLPLALTNAELDALFQPYGSIITSKILLDPDNGIGRGVGFVRFDKYSQAETAIAALNGKQIVGSQLPLLVKFANPPKGTNNTTSTGVLGTSVTPNATPTNGSPIATQIQKRVTQQSMTTNNGGIGPMRHTPTVTNMRYNPVSISNIAANPVAMAAAMNNMSNLTAITTGVSTANPGNFCIFVYNLPENCPDSLLYQLFSPFGAITSVNVIRDLKSGAGKRYGFVNMVNYEDACRAILSLDGYVHDGKQLQVSFKCQKK
jgi:ELAV/HuD family splicing factor